MPLKKSINTRGVNTPQKSGDDIPCFCCGVCCTGYQVHMELEEAHTVANRLGLEWQTFLDDYSDPRWPGTRSVLLRHSLYGCLFLDQPEGSPFGLCRIHSFKPQCCRDWQARLWKKECRQGLSKFWGLSVDDNNQITGSPEAVQVFQTYLKTLS
jgi:Fe-S-cluster containining protein